MIRVTATGRYGSGEKEFPIKPELLAGLEAEILSHMKVYGLSECAVSAVQSPGTPQDSTEGAQGVQKG